MSRLALLLALMAVSACSSPRAPLAPSTKADWPVGEADRRAREADRLFREADDQLGGGHPAAAIRILEDVVRRFPDAPIHDQALYDVARVLVLTANGGREYRQAVAHLDRLLREHPASRHAADARTLRAALGAYVARTDELDRLLERLRTIDLEFERPRRP